MISTHLFIGLVLTMACQFVFAQPPATKADWTLLVYMNGKNNLEGAAITDFYEMAEVGSSANVNVVVQMGRPRRHYSRAEGMWSGVYRFRVTKGQRPRRGSELLDLKKEGLNTDMASPDTLEDFLRWGTKEYPSKRTMLVIWNHGQGWRFQLAKDPAQKDAAAKAARSTTEMQVLAGVREAPPVTSGHRAVSSDDDTGKILYNRQIQNTLQKLAGQGIKMDLIGFDACLMSMLETAYALRKTSSYMVASEELEPFNGWNYRTILRQLAKKPDVDALELATILVTSYKSQYEDGDRTTLSAINLQKVEPFARSLSSLANLLLEKLQEQRALITAARRGLRSFGEWDEPPLHTSIDLKLFLNRLKDRNPNSEIVAAINNTLGLLTDVVVQNYRAAPVADDGYGGSGLAVYFPATKDAFSNDRFGDGYLTSNTLHPLEFVTSPETSGWAKLVRKLLE